MILFRGNGTELYHPGVAFSVVRMNGAVVMAFVSAFL